MKEQWEELSADEKQEELFEKWISPGDIEFDSPQAEKQYKERTSRIKDAIQLKKLPDRVPVVPMLGFFPAYYVGLTPKDIMYDYDKLSMAFTKYVFDFEPDTHFGLAVPGPGRVFDILDYRLYSWPGHGTAPEHIYQCVEKEYMKADEYDALIQDPSYYFTSTYLPRIFGALESFRELPNLTHIQEIVPIGLNLVPFGDKNVQAAYKTLFKAGNEAAKWADFVSSYEKKMAAAGFPPTSSGFTKVAYDVIGDTLRGTRGIVIDIYRQPDKVLAALEALTPIMIDIGVSAAKAAGNPIVFIPLHKGADGFLSDEQFRTFYWPYFKKLLAGLIDEGCVPCSFVEGSYNTRLEILRDLPGGKVLWIFDKTDMGRAKEILGDVACIGGNIPSELLSVGTPQDVKDYAKKLIDTAGKGGGYIMSNGVVMDEVKPENVRAMIDFTKEYGVYK
ncbi:uroporphyrinogen decarboxylase family protein [Chloroflexota bacterium]